MLNMQNQNGQSSTFKPDTVQGYHAIDDLPLVLTVEQTAKALNIGKSLVYELVRCGKLQSLRIGRKIRVPKNSIQEFLTNPP